MNCMLNKLEKKLILLNDYSLSNLGNFKNVILEELKNAKYNDLEDLVYKFQLTFVEIKVLLDLNILLDQQRDIHHHPV